MGTTSTFNNLIKLPENTIDQKSLKIGDIVNVKKTGQRTIPTGLAFLVADHDWTFLGYGVVLKLETSPEYSLFTVKILSLFNPDEQLIYKKRFLEAGKLTGEIKQ